MVRRSPYQSRVPWESVLCLLITQNLNYQIIQHGRVGHKINASIFSDFYLFKYAASGYACIIIFHQKSQAKFLRSVLNAGTGV
jgi:hypothetical protein